MSRRRRLRERGRRLLRVLFPGIVVALVLPTGAAFAQGESGLEVVEVDTGAHPVVRVTVSAPRELVGREIPAEAFTLTENGDVHGVDVTRLDSERLEVMLIIDTSGSMQGEAMPAAKAAAIGFVRAMPPGTEVAVVGFGSEVVVASPFSSDPGALAGVIDGLVAQGETALYDAVSASVREFANRPPARRAVVLLSDGGDTVSSANLEQAVATVGRLEADFFAVALATSEADAGALEQIAGAAGGRVVSAGDPAQLAEVYGTIASRLVNQYVVEYESTAEGTTDIAVTVEHDGVSAAGSQTVDLPALPAALDAEGPADIPVQAITRTAGPLDGRWTLLVGGVAFGVAFAVAGFLLLRTREPRRRLAREIDSGGDSTSGGWLHEVSERATGVAERMLERRERTGALNASLDRAGLHMRPGEFVVVIAGSALLAGAFGLAFGGPLLAVVLAGGVVPGARTFLNFRAQRRRARFADQLGDTLQLLAGSLRSGYSLPQAVDAVARESESPTREEFRRLIVETRLGRNFSQSMRALADRVGNEDFDWVVQAVDIHREVGGDLAEIFDQVGETIRDRNRIRRQVKALSAEGRISGVILFALPFVVAFMVSMTNPDYIAALFEKPAGNVMLGGAAVLMTVGGLWLRRIIRPEF